MIRQVKAWDLKVGDNVRLTHESKFHALTEIDFHYPGGQHLGQAPDDTVRLGVGWGCGYVHPEQMVEVLTLDTADELIASILNTTKEDV